MLTGNGRHRRPRQAPALLVAAGVTGSAIAIPLLGAASASAADGTTWDKVAECESGGSWSASTGNGYYGGLQISQDDWDKYGGATYASSADQASRSQQIAVAEKILADQGTTPWATCALLSGLTSNSGSVDVDTGVGGSGSSDSGSGSGSVDSGDSSGSTDSSGSAGTSDSSGLPDSSSSSDSSSNATTKPSPSASKDAGSTGSDKSKSKSKDKGADAPKSDKSSSPGSGGTQESGPATTDPATEDSDNSGQTGGSWSLVDTGALSSGGRHRGESADESVTNGQSATSSGRHASRDASTYTVREGDTLCSIADSLDVDGGWRALYAENKKAIGADPNDIAPGQTLDVGAENGGK
ncbi:peptigoglycan-binding protein LysM [Streptomyces cellostaticus]|uniref:Peptigoglycan-binding protein LysM n=1 Tax=Streptomyces cellostaticus TaxID=67285 RepID=A0A101NJV8_9ACTN|nr:transglycosylase family protein [Streptomyces cellostaticus]KUM94392.1 peptigoglycan-binding protein LysM [Streptomyces cellostaticus]GHI07139.1 peptidoglycan-binding protein LysM [Streptomyces cellostaticus]